MTDYSPGLGRYLNRTSVSLLGRATETADTTHTPQELGDLATLYLAVVVYTTPTGTTPTLKVIIEGSDDSITFFELGRIGANGFAVANGTQPSDINAIGTFRGIFPIPRYVRSRSDLGGTTPSFDYSIGGSAA